MRVLVLLAFVVLGVAFLAALAYRARVASLRAKRRELEELRRRPTPDELYRSGAIDLDEYERLVEKQLEREQRRARRS